MAEPEPLQAAKSLMSRLPPPPISRIQARINASRALTGQRYRRGVVPTATAELTDGKVHPDGQAEPSALVLPDSPKGKKKRSKKKKRKGDAESEEEVEVLEVGFEAATVIAKESCGTMTLGVRLSAAAPALRLGETPLSVDFYTVDVSKTAHGGSNIAADGLAFLCTLSSDCLETLFASRVMMSTGLRGQGTAEAGTDYIESKGTLIFRPGECLAAVSVKIVEDDAFEPDETFTVHLRNAVGTQPSAPAG